MTRAAVVGIAWGVLVGCTSAPEVSQTGNSLLGIEQFVVEESAELTTVRGLGPAGQEVGRLDLVHGRFTLSPYFADGYDDPAVDGRKLDVTVLGQQMVWETEGYTPTLSMPAHPPAQWAIAAFLEDPHVRPVLVRWQIGFSSSKTETAYNQGYWDYGTDPYPCSGQTNCGLNVLNKPMNTCSGTENLAADQAWRITHMSNDWYKIAQCCPPTPGVLGGQTYWAGIKTCPLDGSSSSQCGDLRAGAACKACQGYPVPQNPCDVWLTLVEDRGHQHENIYELNYTFSAATFACGDDECTGGETCSSCPEDCGPCPCDPDPSLLCCEQNNHCEETCSLCSG